MKISLKIALTYVVLLCIVLVILSGSVLLGVRYYLIQQSMNQVKDQYNTIIERIKDEHYRIPLDDKDLFETGLNNVGIRLYLKNGRLIYSSNNIKKIPYEIPFRNKINLINKIEIKENHVVYLNKRLLSNNNIYYLQIIKNMDNEYNFIKTLFTVLAFADAVGIFVSIFIGFMITKRVLQPIDYIIKKVKSISTTDLNTRLYIKGPEDEFTRLAQTFNEMLDRIQDSFVRQERFVSDASHELRTPVAAIKGYIDMLDRWGKNDASVLQEGINAIKNLTDDMSKLIERLLFLAKIDDDIVNIEREKFLLNDIIDGVVEEYRILSREHLIEVKHDGKAYIYADKNFIKELLRIFIDNSIKYTPPRGKITIETHPKTKWIQIIIRDTGIGIPEEDIPFIFERFYRVDKSRSKKFKGWGLGLSIAKWIIDKHGGNVNVKSKIGEGTTFIINLPNNLSSNDSL